MDVKYRFAYRFVKRPALWAVLLAGALSACGGGANIAPLPSSLQFQPLVAPASVFPTALKSAPTGIVGNLITDLVSLSGGSTSGALYDLSSGVWTPIVVPGATSTATYGPAITSTGYRLVGNYSTADSSLVHGFAYDSTTGAYTTLDPPAAFCAPFACTDTIMHSNFGSTAFKAVGNSDSVLHPPFGDYPTTGHAILYDSATASFTLIDISGSVSSTAYGIWIDGATVAVAGGFTDAKGTHAYVRDLTGGTIVDYDYPNSVVTHFEGITGAGGAGNYNVIGDAVSVQNGTETGFFLPIRNWVAGTPIVLGTTLSANSVYQRTVIGIMGSPSAGYIVNVPGS